MDISCFLNQLVVLKNPERAARDKEYHKSVREHWGIPVPVCDQVARAIGKDLSPKEILEVATSLWETDLFDPMICATKLISLTKVKPSVELWNTILFFLQKVDGWALEDSLAPKAGKCILANEEYLEMLEEWTKHENFWMRRAALVYTLPYAKPRKNPERSLEWASRYASDPEWFIQKAIGWWLRDLSEHNPERVVSFLKDHWHQLATVARHEAKRKLEPEWQKQLIQFTRN